MSNVPAALWESEAQALGFEELFITVEGLELFCPAKGGLMIGT